MDPWLGLVILLAAVFAVYPILRPFVGVLAPRDLDESKQSSDETEKPPEQ
jgi:hypothetical protein